MKIKGDDQAYEKVKKMTRGKIKGYELELLKVRNLKVEKYIGLAVEITEQTIRRLR